MDRRSFLGGLMASLASPFKASPAEAQNRRRSPRPAVRPTVRPNFNLRLYAVDKAGRYASAAIWSGGRFAIAGRNGARIEEQAYLYRNGRR